jgi:alpha-galactosidase
VVVTGVVAEDGSEAWYVVATVGATATQHLAPVLLPGLDEDASYLLTGETPTRDQHVADVGTTWLDGDGLVLSGRVAGRAGVAMPVLAPETARVLRAVRR